MRKSKGKKRREMESQLAALKGEIGERGWKRIEEVIEGDYDEDEWERVVGEVLAGLGEEGGGDGDGEDEGEGDDEKPTWDDEDEMYGEEWDEVGEGNEQGEGVDEDGPINMVS